MIRPNASLGAPSLIRGIGLLDNFICRPADFFLSQPSNEVSDCHFDTAVGFPRESGAQLGSFALTQIANATSSSLYGQSQVDCTLEQEYAANSNALYAQSWANYTFEQECRVNSCTGINAEIVDPDYMQQGFFLEFTMPVLITLGILSYYCARSSNYTDVTDDLDPSDLIDVSNHNQVDEDEKFSDSDTGYGSRASSPEHDEANFEDELVDLDKQPHANGGSSCSDLVDPDQIDEDAKREEACDFNVSRPPSPRLCRDDKPEDKLTSLQVLDPVGMPVHSRDKNHKNEYAPVLYVATAISTASFFGLIAFSKSLVEKIPSANAGLIFLAGVSVVGLISAALVGATASEFLSTNVSSPDVQLVGKDMPEACSR